MPTLAISCTVTRTELGLGALQLNDHDSYELIEIGPGAVSFRRQTATSPYVHGETLVSRVKDTQHGTAGVRALATTAAQLDARIAALLAAFEQFSYDMVVVIDGVSRTWRCQSADYGVGEGGTFEKYGLMVYRQDVRFDFPRSPIPVAGSM